MASYGSGEQQLQLNIKAANSSADQDENEEYEEEEGEQSSTLLKIDDYKEEEKLMQTPTAKDQNYNSVAEPRRIRTQLIISAVSEQENDESPGEPADA